MKNIDRSAGTILGAEITRFHKEGLPEDTIVVNCKGVGGQSFGAFIPKGLTMTLCGDTNDYYGKDFPVENWLYIRRRTEDIKPRKYH
mgnify:CR=1 FL=1